MRGGASAPPKGGVHRKRWWAAAVPASALAVLVAAAVLLTATAVGAQTGVDLRPQIRNLTNQIASLRDQLADLERVVHAGAAPRGAAADAGSDAGASERNSQRLAELETDIDEAREWRRRVTGRFEEFDNALRRLEGRIERLVADVDFRLSALEQGQTTPRAAQPPLPPVRCRSWHLRTSARLASRINRAMSTSLPPRLAPSAPYRRMSRAMRCRSRR